MGSRGKGGMLVWLECGREALGIFKILVWEFGL